MAFLVTKDKNIQKYFLVISIFFFWTSQYEYLVELNFFKISTKYKKILKNIININFVKVLVQFVQDVEKYQRCVNNISNFRI